MRKESSAVEEYIDGYYNESVQVYTSIRNESVQVYTWVLKEFLEVYIHGYMTVHN